MENVSVILRAGHNVTVARTHQLARRLNRAFDTYGTTAGHPPFDTNGIRQALMDSLVGDTFESAQRMPVAHSDVLLIAIESDVHQLIDTMEDGFSRAFE